MSKTNLLLLIGVLLVLAAIGLLGGGVIWGTDR